MRVIHTHVFADYDVGVERSSCAQIQCLKIGTCLSFISLFFTNERPIFCRF